MHFTFLIEPLMVPILLPFGVKPETAFAELGPGALRLKFGNIFEHTLKLKKIARAEQSQWPLYQGLGHRLWFGKKVGVLASARNVVVLQFKEPTPLPFLLGFHYEANELYLSVEDPEKFVEAVNAAL